MVFFDFNDFYTEHIQTRKAKMLLEEKIPRCQIGILKCMDSVAANRFCEQMFITEAKIVVFKGLKGKSFKIRACQSRIGYHSDRVFILTYKLSLLPGSFIRHG